MKLVATFLLALLLVGTACLRSHAQSTGQVTGQLRSGLQEPLAYATVVLRQVRDTTWVRGEVSKDDGSYAFKGLVPGQYRLTVLLGYQPHRSATFAVAAAPAITQLPAIVLAPAAHALTGVEVTGQKSLLEMQTGKIVLNVAASPSAAVKLKSSVLELVSSTAHTPWFRKWLGG